MTRWDMTYLGMDTFISECASCDWSHTGSIAECQNAAVRHVKAVHL